MWTVLVQILVICILFQFNFMWCKPNLIRLLQFYGILFYTYISPKINPIFIKAYGSALCTIFTILLTLWKSEQKNGLLIKCFCFSSDFDETWWSCSYPFVLQFHQIASKSDEKQKSYINSMFFCSDFQSVSRIVEITHSATGHMNYKYICNI